MQKRYLIIDFDSTLVKVESLDLLAEIALEHKDNKEEMVTQIKWITERGMEGQIDFGESLKQRIDLFKPTESDVEALKPLLIQNISESVDRNTGFFHELADSIYIISGGFTEFILPVAEKLGIKSDHILANKLLWKDGFCIGFDTENFLAHKGGKVKAVQQLGLDGEVVVIGDGYTDFEIKKERIADVFIAFVENVNRITVVQDADYVATSFDQVIEILRGLGENQGLSDKM